MPQTQTMTLDEKLAIGVKAAELRKAGDKEEASRLLRSAPMPPYLAKVAKEKIGIDFLINGGWNLAEIGLLSDIYQSALAIDFGRKGFATRGKEQEGRACQIFCVNAKTY